MLLHYDEFDQTFTRVNYEPNSPEVGSILNVHHWLLTDHLKSVRLVLDESGGEITPNTLSTDENLIKCTLYSVLKICKHYQVKEIKYLPRSECLVDQNGNIYYDNPRNRQALQYYLP